MHIIGILGGVASGKSLVTEQLACMGAGVLDADRAAHVVLKMPAIEQAVRKHWGPRVFGPDNRIDRRELARVVFAPPPGGPEQRKCLEQMTHPEIGRLLAAEAKQMEASGKVAAILDAPLLLEAGWDSLCDRLLFVDAPWELRLARTRLRGWTREEFVARETAQESLDFKRRRADVVVDNSGSPEETRVQLQRFWASLVG